jgi:hypothetical protein
MTAAVVFAPSDAAARRGEQATASIRETKLKRPRIWRRKEPEVTGRRRYANWSVGFVPRFEKALFSELGGQATIPATFRVCVFVRF